MDVSLIKWSDEVDKVVETWPGPKQISQLTCKKCEKVLLDSEMMLPKVLPKASINLENGASEVARENIVSKNAPSHASEMNQPKTKSSNDHQKQFMIKTSPSENMGDLLDLW